MATLQMVQALIDEYDITVVCYYQHDDKMVARYESAGARVLLLEETRSGLKGLWRLLWRLVKLFREERPDVVHGVYFAPGSIPLLAARIAGVPKVFATVHAAGGRGYGLKAKTMFRISAILTTHFFCVAENTERFWFGSVGGNKHSTIHNGIDIEAFAKAEAVTIPSIADDAIVVGIVGSVFKLKGHDCLFRAVKRLIPEFPNLQILVVGDGRDRQYFESVATELAITERIHWAGRVEPEDIPKYYKRMDVLAMPSHWEGFGLAAAEAMAACVPVVGSDVPGLREVIGDAGILFPVNADKALAEAIKTILANREEWSKRVSCRVERFALHAQQEKWRRTYKSLIEITE
ncbi:MAG: glycosyltransferase [Spirochaetia bacterium]|nr:glycosyltransferase [Spirochaetia bacterium]